MGMISTTPSGTIREGPFIPGTGFTAANESFVWYLPVHHLSFLYPYLETALYPRYGGIGNFDCFSGLTRGTLLQMKPGVALVGIAAGSGMLCHSDVVVPRWHYGAFSGKSCTALSARLDDKRFRHYGWYILSVFGENHHDPKHNFPSAWGMGCTNELSRGGMIRVRPCSRGTWISCLRAFYHLFR